MSRTKIIVWLWMRCQRSDLWPFGCSQALLPCLKVRKRKQWVYKITHRLSNLHLQEGEAYNFIAVNEPPRISSQLIKPSLRVENSSLTVFHCSVLYVYETLDPLCIISHDSQSTIQNWINQDKQFLIWLPIWQLWFG